MYIRKSKKNKTSRVASFCNSNISTLKLSRHNDHGGLLRNLRLFNASVFCPSFLTIFRISYFYLRGHTKTRLGGISNPTHGTSRSLFEFVSSLQQNSSFQVNCTDVNFSLVFEIFLRSMFLLDF